jgi:hypothetical protein
MTGWPTQKINLGGNTNAPQALFDPFVSVYWINSGFQQHVAYQGPNGSVWDALFDPNQDSWRAQQINLGGMTNGPAATRGLSVGVFNQQQHFLYLSGAGESPVGDNVYLIGSIQDSWYDSQRWRGAQQINQSSFPNPNALTNGPGAAAAADLGGGVGQGPAFAVSIWQWGAGDGSQMHCTYRADSSANHAIFDAFWDSGKNQWFLQQITSPPGTSGGWTNGPEAVGDPFGCVYNQQEHIGYRDFNGNIWDAWYDGPRNRWNLQQINGKQANPQAMTSGPAAVGGPFIWTWGADPNNIRQQHFTYRDASGAIWDAYYDGPTNNWHLQQINLRHLKSNFAPPAVTDPFVCVFYTINESEISNSQQHIAYQDAFGAIWDVFYDPLTNSWDAQKVNLGGNSDAPKAAARGEPGVGAPGSGVFVWSWSDPHVQQLHFTYVADGGAIWDTFFNVALPIGGRG